MRHPLVFRALLGGAGVAGCIAVLGSAARAAEFPIGMATSHRMTPAAAPIAPNLFGTVALQIRGQRFDGEWERARRDASGLPQMQQLIAPARSLSPERQLVYVQAAVNRRIRWMSDATLRGRHDYWASAAETLAAGAGDDKDRAILKMQALHALGFPTSSLYLTLGRDRVGGPESVLLVRLGSRAYVLDDTDAPPYAPEHRPEFTPVLSFGYGASWVHAQIRRRAPVAVPPGSPITAVAAAATALRGGSR
jgi:predicted transglutaminase-like cysteine proteinase